MESSSVFFKICEIQTQPYRWTRKYNDSPLHDYTFTFDEIHNIQYIGAEVRSDSLDKGSEPTEHSHQCVRCYGVSGDRAAHYIGIKLGGGGEPRNVFPLNSQLDTSNWKAAEDRVYEHVKKGDNRHARLMYGIQYDEEHDDEVARPSKIFYYFQLYEDDKSVGTAIEGVFENISPRFTKEDFYPDPSTRRPLQFNQSA